MIPDAILSALIEVKNARKATREIAKVQLQLREATKDANIATAAVNRFGRTRGIAVLDVNAAKARAQTKAAQEAVNGFGSEHATATLTADASDAHRAVAGATEAVNGYGHTNGTATLGANGTDVLVETAKATAHVRAFDGLTAEARAELKIAGATAKIAQLRALLADLGAQDPTIEVRVRAAKAIADLERAEAERRKLTDGMRDMTGPADDAGRALRQVGDGGRNGGGGMRFFVASFGDLPGRIYLSTRLLGALLNIMITMAPVLIGLGAQLVAVTAALAPLAGLGAGVAGAMVAAAQGFGVLKLATAGIGDALKEQIRNQTQAASTAISAASQQRAAARQVQSAQDSLKTATRAVTDAEREQRDAAAQLGPAYAAARRALADMRAEARSSVLSVARMSLGLRDARQALDDLIRGASPLDLADAQDRVADATRGVDRALLNLTDAQAAFNAAATDPAATSQDIAKARQDLADAENAIGDAQRDAQRAAQALAELEKPANARDLAGARLAVAEAERGLTDARTAAARQQSALNAAEAAGLARAPEVLAVLAQITDAEGRLRDAHEQVEDAQQGVRDAQIAARESMAGAAVAAANLNEKLSGLPAPAQAFVRELIAMKPRLDELRATAAAGFFPGATEGLRAAAGSFGSLNRVVGETSTVLGDAARKSGELVGSPAFGRDIEIIGGRNAQVIGTLGEALRHVISAFRHVLVAAGPLTQWLADVANKWALNAAEAAKAGRESGRLAEFFDRAKQTAQKLGSIIGNLSSGLFGLGKASSETGRDILDDLDRLTERFSVWANSAKGRNEIAAFMDKAHDAMKEVGPALGALVSAFARFATNILPAYARILSVIGPAMDELVTIFLAWKIAATGAAIATAGLKVAMAIATFVTGGWVTAFWALNAAMAANPIGLVVLAIAGLVAGLVIAYKKSETFRNAVDAVWGALKTAFGWVQDNWPLLLVILTGPIGLAVLVIASHWESIKAGAAAAWEWIKGAAAMAWNLIKVAITTPINVAASVIAGVWEGIKAAAVFAWGAIKGAASLAWEAIKAVIVNPIRAVVEFGKARFDDLKAGLGAIWAAIKSAAGTAWGGVKSAITGPIGDAVSFVRDKIGDVVGWLGEKWDALVVGAKVFGLLFKNTMARAFAGVANTVIGFINAIIGAINTVLDLVGIGKIGKVGTVDVPDRLSVKDAAKQAQGFARGGAFARTGGIVDRPITLMGEEAPNHREFVVPTNPAYRDRALGLWAQAGQEIGAFAKGGRYSVDDMTHLASSVKAQVPAVMGAIGMAESSGNPAAHGPPDGRGLWQIEWPVWAKTMAGKGLSNAYDAEQNARMMKVVQEQQGLNAWVVYNTGAYKKFLGDEGGGGILSKIGGAIKGAAGAIGELASKGVGWLLDKLPGVDGLPDWLKGTGRFVLDKATGFIKDKAAGLLGIGGGGGGELPGGISGDIKEAIAFSRTIGKWTFGPGQLFRPGGTTYHGQGRAVDFGDAGHSAGEMRALYGGLKSRYGKHIKELFYDPMGEHVKNGRVVGSPFGGHGDHVHLALAQGGLYGGQQGVLGSFRSGTDYVPRTGPYELHKGEAVTPARENGAPIEVHVTFDGLPVELQKLVRVEITRNGRELDAKWKAGRA